VGTGRRGSGTRAAALGSVHRWGTIIGALVQVFEWTKRAETHAWANGPRLCPLLC
jgi:hypothetical protein